MCPCNKPRRPGSESSRGQGRPGKAAGRQASHKRPAEHKTLCGAQDGLALPCHPWVSLSRTSAPIPACGQAEPQGHWQDLAFWGRDITAGDARGTG